MWLGVIWEGGAGKSDRRDMPDVFVMKLERAASEEKGTPRLDSPETMRVPPDRRLSAGLSIVSSYSISVRCVENRSGCANTEGVETASISPTLMSVMLDVSNKSQEHMGNATHEQGFPRVAAPASRKHATTPHQ